MGGSQSAQAVSPEVAGLGCAAFDGPIAHPPGEVLIIAANCHHDCVAFEHAQAYLADKLK